MKRFSRNYWVFFLLIGVVTVICYLTAGTSAAVSQNQSCLQCHSNIWGTTPLVNRTAACRNCHFAPGMEYHPGVSYLSPYGYFKSSASASGNASTVHPPHDGSNAWAGYTSCAPCHAKADCKVCHTNVPHSTHSQPTKTYACIDCHKDLPTVTQPQCTSCHPGKDVPHGGDHSLIESNIATCALSGCHDQGDLVAIHAYEGFGCDACHGPNHEYEYELWQRDCAYCHPDFTGTTVHEIHSTLDCLTCHPDFPSPDQHYVATGDEACTVCHQGNLIGIHVNNCSACHGTSGTEPAAGRSCQTSGCHPGITNIHAAHEGVTCTTCHVPGTYPAFKYSHEGIGERNCDKCHGSGSAVHLPIWGRGGTLYEDCYLPCHTTRRSHITNKNTDCSRCHGWGHEIHPKSSNLDTWRSEDPRGRR